MKKDTDHSSLLYNTLPVHLHLHVHLHMVTHQQHNIFYGCNDALLLEMCKNSHKKVHYINVYLHYALELWGWWYNRFLQKEIREKHAK